MAIAYIVTAGDYSSYKIRAVFSARELAEKFIAMYPEDCNHEEHKIEEYEVDPFESEMQAGLTFYTFIMDINGDTSHFSAFSPDYPLPEGMTVVFNSSMFETTQTLDKGYLYVRILAKSQEAAIKIANEVRTQLLATDNWKDRYNYKSSV